MLGPSFVAFDTSANLLRNRRQTLWTYALPVQGPRNGR